MESKGILEKIKFLMTVSKTKKISSADLKYIEQLTHEDSNDLVLGKVFGHSVSDYAFASLKWIESDETDTMYERLSNNLTENRLQNIQALIRTNVYAEF